MGDQGLGISLAKKLIFLMEADKKLAHHLEEVISRAGYQVKSTEKIEKRLFHEIARAAKVFVWDSESPPFSLSELSAAARHKKYTPVIILTGSHRVETKIEGLESGAYDYLTKPVSTDKLLRAIELMLKRAEYAESAGYWPTPTAASTLAAPPKQKPALDASTASRAGTVVSEDLPVPKPKDESDWKPILSVRKWRWIIGSCLIAGLLIFTLELCLGPDKVPGISFFVILAAMPVITIFAIYEWWHWVNT